MPGYDNVPSMKAVMPEVATMKGNPCVPNMSDSKVTTAHSCEMTTSPAHASVTTVTTTTPSSAGFSQIDAREG